MNFYLDVLLESILVSTPIPFVGNPTFFAMHGFGGYNMPLAAVVAVIGSAIGAAASFFFGYMFLKLYRKQGGERHLSREKYNLASHYFARYFIFILPFSWLPLFNFLAMVAGFLGMRYKLVLPLIIAGQIAHYGYYVFN